MAWNNVDFPAPLDPMIATASPRLHVERDSCTTILPA